MRRYDVHTHHAYKLCKFVYMHSFIVVDAVRNMLACPLDYVKIR